MVLVTSVETGDKQVLALDDAVFNTYAAVRAWFTRRFALSRNGRAPMLIAIVMMKSSTRKGIRVQESRTVGSPECPRADLLDSVCQRACLSFLALETSRCRRFFIQAMDQGAARRACRGPLAQLLH